MQVLASDPVLLTRFNQTDFGSCSHQLRVCVLFYLFQLCMCLEQVLFYDLLFLRVCLFVPFLFDIVVIESYTIIIEESYSNFISIRSYGWRFDFILLHFTVCVSRDFRKSELPQLFNCTIRCISVREPIIKLQSKQLVLRAELTRRTNRVYSAVMRKLKCGTAGKPIGLSLYTYKRRKFACEFLLTPSRSGSEGCFWRG